MPVPFWLGNQFNFAPAKFHGYTFPQPQALQPQGLFAPPPSLFQAPWNQSGGEGQNQDGPPGTGVPGPVGGPAQEISDFATNPGMRGMAMGIPGLGLAMGLANLGAQASMAPPGQFGFMDALSSAFGFSPVSHTLAQIAMDPMGNFGPEGSPNEGSPVGAPEGMGNFGGSDPGYDASPTGPSGDSSGPSGDPSGAGDGVGGAAFARGGHVTMDALMGMDPVGPDDGYGALDAGEYVLTAKAAKKIGAKNLAKLNKGKFNKADLGKALRAKKSKLKKLRHSAGD